MQVTVGTTPVEIIISSNDVDIQNLGTGNVYVSRSETVATTGPGIEIGTGEVYSFTNLNGVPFWLVADAAGQDVRIERA